MGLYIFKYHVQIHMSKSLFLGIHLSGAHLSQSLITLSSFVQYQFIQGETHLSRVDWCYFPFIIYPGRIFLELLQRHYIFFLIKSDNWLLSIKRETE